MFLYRQILQVGMCFQFTEGFVNAAGKGIKTAAIHHKEQALVFIGRNNFKAVALQDFGICPAFALADSKFFQIVESFNLIEFALAIFIDNKDAISKQPFVKTNTNRN